MLIFKYIKANLNKEKFYLNENGNHLEILLILMT